MGHPILEHATTRAAALVAVDGRHYPLVSAQLDARAEGGMAATRLRQTYANPYDEALEVIYTLPLPADGAVLGYSIRIGEKRIVGEVAPREQAAAAYREALYRGQTAGLLEELRRDTFEQRLGNVPGHTSVEIEIDVLHPLAFIAASTPRRAEPLSWYQRFLSPEGRSRPEEPGEASGNPLWEYRFPTVVGVRYHGAPGRVPDAEALSPDRADGAGIPAEVALSLTIADATSAPIQSPSHAIVAVLAEPGWRVNFPRGERLDRDVVVRWEAPVEPAGVRVVEGRGLAGDDGRYALVTVVPPSARREPFGRDVTVLLDASGSMSGTPLELARRVVAELIKSCEHGDRFELLAFSNDVRSLTGGMTAATERSVREALAALDAVRAGGGTEMSNAVERALGNPRDDTQRQIVLVTDGEIGFEREVVGRIGNAPNTRFHVVGVGSSPNRGLTAAAAAAGRGLEILVGNEHDADDAARRLVAGTSRPVLVDLAVSGDALAKPHAAPLRDVYAGQPLVFAVELTRKGGSLALHGELAGGQRAWTATVEVPGEPGANARAATPLPVGALYGRALIGQLEIALDCDRSGERPGLESSIQALGMRHRIVSRFTSLVAIADEPAVDPRAPRRRTRLAVEVPSGVSAEGAGIDYAAPMMAKRIPLMKGTGGARKSIARLEALMHRREGGPLESAAEASMPHPGPIARKLPRAIIDADAHWLGADSLALEFEVPAGGLALPAGGVVVVALLADALGGGLELEVDPVQSAPAGVYPAGVRVRVVLRVPAAFAFGAGERMNFAWRANGASGRGVDEAFVGLRGALPERPRGSN